MIDCVARHKDHYYDYDGAIDNDNKISLLHAMLAPLPIYPSYYILFLSYIILIEK